MNRECNNRVRNGQYRVWGVPKNIYNLGMIFSAFCLDTMLPKGSIVIECGNALLKHGYTIKIFNTINFQKSMHYNRATCSPLKRWRTALFQSVL